MILKNEHRPLLFRALGLSLLLALSLVLYAGYRIVRTAAKPLPGMGFPSGDSLSLPRIQIRIGEEPLRTLQQLRLNALRTGVISAKEKRAFPAVFVSDNESLAVSLRLKGDWTDHLGGKKWSFRIAPEAGRYWRGMREFSIQSPQTRNLLHEWLFHEFLRAEGLLATRYFFAALDLNGESRGIYAVEEHFLKELPESQERREGITLKFSEDLLWEFRARGIERMFLGKDENGDSLFADPWEAAEVQAFEEKRIREDAALSAQYAQACILMQQLHDGTVPPSQIMDVQKTARFLAATDLFFAYHGLQWHNLRFHYDPLSQRLELIGFDANIFASRGLPDPIPLFAAGFDPGSKGIVKSFTRDPQIRKAYLAEVQRMSAPGYMEAFLVQKEKALAAYEHSLTQEFMGYAYPRQELLKVRDRVAQRLLLETEFGGSHAHD